MPISANSRGGSGCHVMPQARNSDGSRVVKPLPMSIVKPNERRSA